MRRHLTRRLLDTLFTCVVHAYARAAGVGCVWHANNGKWQTHRWGTDIRGYLSEIIADLLELGYAPAEIDGIAIPIIDLDTGTKAHIYLDVEEDAPDA